MCEIVCDFNMRQKHQIEYFKTLSQSAQYAIIVNIKQFYDMLNLYQIYKE